MGTRTIMPGQELNAINCKKHPIAITWVHFLKHIECNSKPHIHVIYKAACTRAIEPPNDLKEGFPQSVLIPLVISITIDKIHHPKVYADLYQNVCIT